MPCAALLAAAMLQHRDSEVSWQSKALCTTSVWLGTPAMHPLILTGLALCCWLPPCCSTATAR